MKKLWLAAIVLVPLMAVASSFDQTLSYDPKSESYGYSSEDFPGGGSYLGVNTQDITPDRVGALKLKDESGVEITTVDQDSPAGKVGLKEHDVILTVNGNKVESVEQLRRMIREIPAGRTAKLGVSRNGQFMNFDVQLAERDKFMAGHVPKFNVHIPPMPPMPNIGDMDIPQVSVVVVHSSVRSGLMIENLTPQLGDYFGAKNGQGVLVRSVEKGSRAEKAGFRAGDVIVKVGKEAVHDSGDFSHALQAQRSGGSVPVGIIRDRKVQTITLTLPERKQSGDLFPEESFDFPEINIDADFDIQAINTEMAQLRPQIELAVREVHNHVEKVNKEMVQHRKELLNQQKEMRRQQRELQRQLRDQSSRWRNQWNEKRRELQRELLELQHGSAEI
jgi:serine protease Do